jgi:hypothetical protein
MGLESILSKLSSKRARFDHAVLALEESAGPFPPRRGTRRNHRLSVLSTRSAKAPRQALAAWPTSAAEAVSLSRMLCTPEGVLHPVYGNSETALLGLAPILDQNRLAALGAANERKSLSIQ